METQSIPWREKVQLIVRFLRGSVTDRNDWLRALDGQHAVIHLAAETGTGQSMYEIEKYTAVNIGGTSLMLDILTNTKHSVSKVVVAASRAIYGEGRYLSEEMGYVYPLARADEDMRRGDFECKYPGCTKPLRLVGTTEDSAIHPTSVYGITKQVQEQLVMTVCPAIGIAPVAFRYQNVYGPGQSLSNPYTGILSIFSETESISSRTAARRAISSISTMWPTRRSSVWKRPRPTAKPSMSARAWRPTS